MNLSNAVWTHLRLIYISLIHDMDSAVIFKLLLALVIFNISSQASAYAGKQPLANVCSILKADVRNIKIMIRPTRLQIDGSHRDGELRPLELPKLHRVIWILEEASNNQLRSAAQGRFREYRCR